MSGIRVKPTPAFDARIRKCYENHERVADVAAELGVTRNSIIGRARRLGLAVPGGNYASPHYSTWSSETRALLSRAKLEYWKNRRENEAV